MKGFSSIPKTTWGVRCRKAMQLLGAVFALLLLCLPAYSQGNFGRILGNVTDQSGGVVSGATVTVLDTQRGLSRTLTTDDTGAYNAPTLIPGTYTVSVEANGFKKLERRNVVLQVGEEVRVDLTVEPGEQNQTITVTEAIPLVETTNATLGGELSNTEINDMPLNGRNFQNLMSLRPGIMVQPGGSPWSQSTNNIRPDETDWMIDGVISVSFYDARPVGNSPSSFTDAATIVPIDAIQEFTVQENPKAEYGWKPGAVVNVGIRSGTNNLHGTAYAFGRDAGLDARNAFNPGLEPNGSCAPNPVSPAVCDKLPTELKQFGATVGGPIKKDKLFFFAGYEGLRDLIGNAFIAQIPENASQANTGAFGPAGDPTNSMVDAVNAVAGIGGGFNPASLSPVSLKLLGCTVGATASATACTGGLYAGAAANSINYLSTFPNINQSDNGIAKMDYVINSKNRISGMFWTGDYNVTGQDHAVVNTLFLSGEQVQSLSTVENWIWTPSSNVVNEVRFGYNRVSFPFTVADSGIFPNGSGGQCSAAGCGGNGYPLNTGVAEGGLPYILIGNFGNPSGGGGLGNSNNARPGITGPSPYSDLQESLSYLHGNHSFKFGVEFAHIEADQTTQDYRGNLVQFQGGQAFTGSTPLEDFFAGDPLFATANVGNGIRKMVWEDYAGFVQDDWRIKPRLMVNLGLRYEYASPIREVNNLFGNFDPNSPSGIVQQGQPGVGSSLWGANPKNFSPRVGFAWDVAGNGTTVVRGGSSVMYSTLLAKTFTDNGPPNGTLGNVAQDPSGACSVPFIAPQTCSSAGGSTFGGTINFGQPTFGASNLNWDPAIHGSALNGGTLFPQGGISCTQTSPCSLMSVDPNLKTPYIVSYNLGVEHAFSNNLSLEVGYVGNFGTNLLSLTDINQCAPNANSALCATGASRPYFSKFPYLQYIDNINNFARSNYNSLQVTMTKRVSHGLELTAGYTYGHGLDDGSLNWGGNVPQNSLNPGAEYGSSDFDIRHRFTLTASYAIPGKKGFGQLLEGWKLNTIVTLQTGQPWLVFDTSHDFSTGGSGFGDKADRWNITGNPAVFASGSSSFPFCAGPNACTQTSGISGISTPTPNEWSKCVAADGAYSTPATSTLATAGCYVVGNSVLTPNALGTYGNMGRNIFRASGFENVDFSVFKDFTFKERFGAEFRAEFFNLFNHPNIANPYGSSNQSYLGSDPSNSSHLGCGCATPDVAAGNPLVGSGSSRVMQLGLKLTY